MVILTIYLVGFITVITYVIYGKLTSFASSAREIYCETCLVSGDILVEYLMSNQIGQKLDNVGVTSEAEQQTVSIESTEPLSNDQVAPVTSVTSESSVASDVKRLRVSVQLNMNEQTFTDADTVSVMMDDDNIFSWQTATQFIQVSMVTDSASSPNLIVETNDNIYVRDIVNSVSDASDVTESSVCLSSNSDVCSPSGSVNTANSDLSKFKSVLNTLLSQLNLKELSPSIEHLSSSPTPHVECSNVDSSLGMECNVLNHVKTNVRVLRSGNVDTLNADDDQLQVKAVFDALVMLLQKCTNWNILMEKDASTETLARLTEFVYTGGTMGFGVQTENALSELAKLLIVSDSCKVNNVDKRESSALNDGTAADDCDQVNSNIDDTAMADNTLINNDVNYCNGAVNSAIPVEIHDGEGQITSFGHRTHSEICANKLESISDDVTSDDVVQTVNSVQMPVLNTDELSDLTVLTADNTIDHSKAPLAVQSSSDLVQGQEVMPAVESTDDENQASAFTTSVSQSEESQFDNGSDIEHAGHQREASSTDNS